MLSRIEIEVLVRRHLDLCIKRARVGLSIAECAEVDRLIATVSEWTRHEVEGRRC